MGNNSAWLALAGCGPTVRDETSQRKCFQAVMRGKVSGGGRDWLSAS
jgi:hypothetical protein